jgi:hypothetical protein
MLFKKDYLKKLTAELRMSNAKKTSVLLVPHCIGEHLLAGGDLVFFQGARRAPISE